MENEHKNKRQLRYGGFTLIELSIVLVIIGLIVGGVLVGKDLIDSASLRAQISQIEKYNLSANAFKLKYGYLPGDIPEPAASASGFAARGTGLGQGDGDGLLQGNAFFTRYGWVQPGEPLMFWVDLSVAGMIDGNFFSVTPTTYPAATVTASALGNYLPKAKIGDGAYIYLLNLSTNDAGGWIAGRSSKYSNNNFFNVAKVSEIHDYTGGNFQVEDTNGIPVIYAYNIDKKIDDGLPVSGRVTTIRQTGGVVYFSNGDVTPMTTSSPPGSGAIAPATTTCYDNNSNAANTLTYSLSQNGGRGLNCGLSFQFQ